MSPYPGAVRSHGWALGPLVRVRGFVSAQASRHIDRFDPGLSPFPTRFEHGGCLLERAVPVLARAELFDAHGKTGAGAIRLRDAGGPYWSPGTAAA